jgi:hypothetical protein
MVQGWLKWKSVLLLNATPGDNDVILDSDVIIRKQEEGGDSEELGPWLFSPACTLVVKHIQSKKKIGIMQELKHRNYIKVSME